MNNNVRKIIFFVMTVGMASASYIYMIKPANRDLVIQKEKFSQKKSKLRELETAPAVLEDINKQLVRLEESIVILDSKLPPKKAIHSILEDVTLIAQKNGLTPKAIRTATSKINNGYIEQPIKMEFEGVFNSYYSFLLSLEKLDRITKINEMTIKIDSENDEIMLATFVISIFFQNDSA